MNIKLIILLTIALFYIGCVNNNNIENYAVIRSTRSYHKDSTRYTIQFNRRGNKVSIKTFRDLSNLYKVGDTLWFTKIKKK